MKIPNSFTTAQLRTAIVDNIRSKTTLGPEPCVFLSGGIDSTIILHHLREQTSAPIHTITAIFGVPQDPIEWSKEVSGLYDTTHSFIKIGTFVERMTEILYYYPQPRWNLWPWWAAEVAEDYGLWTIYTGEGSDEIFGGFPHRSYLEGWQGQLEYVHPSFQISCRYFGLKYITPFRNLDWIEMLPYFAPPDKALLRRAYKDILPNGIAYRPNHPVAFAFYEDIWKAVFASQYPQYNPKTKEEVRECLQVISTQKWLEARKLPKKPID